MNISGIITATVLVAIIEGVREWLSFRRKRKAENEDKADLNTETRLKAVEKQVNALVLGQKYILYDRIRYLGHEYIAAGEIDFDDRRILNDMHSVYHNELNGNGDLKILMNEVNKLPLKKH